MPHYILWAVILFSTVPLLQGYSAFEEGNSLSQSQTLMGKKLSSDGNGCHCSQESLETPSLSASSRPRTPPIPLATPWTVEETAGWISEIAANKKVWPKFFAILSTLTCTSPPSRDVKDYPHLKWYAPATLYGATLRTGFHASQHITHAGLVQQVINNGTLLNALKAAQDKAFFPLIKTLSSSAD